MNLVPLKKRPSLLILLALGPLNVMGGGLLAPVLPELTEPFRTSPGWIGLVLSTYTLAAAVTLPLTGLLIDVYGRQPVGVICLLTTGIAGVTAPLAPGFKCLLLFRFVQGIGLAGLLPVGMAIIRDLYEGETRLNLMGLLSSSLALGTIFIPFLGGYLGEINWRLPFWLYGFSLVLAAFFYKFLDETGNPDGQISWNRAHQHLKKLLSTFRNSQIRRSYSHAFVLYFLLYSLVNFLPVVLDSLHGSTAAQAGLYLSLHGAVTALVASQSVRAEGLLGARLKLPVGYLLLGVSLLGAAVLKSYLLLTVAVFFYGVGFGIVQPAIYHRVTEVAPEHHSGAVIAVFNSMRYVGMSLAPVGLGFAYNLAGPNAPFLVAGVVAITWALLSGHSPPDQD